MITVRTSTYSKDDLIFLYHVLHTGLERNCRLISNMEDNPIKCKDCKQRIACREAQSAMHHLYSIMLRNEVRKPKGK